MSIEDISNVIRLVREVCDRWDDPQAWREHLLHGACRLLHGSAGMMLTEYNGRQQQFGDIAVMSVVGVPPEMRPLVQPAVSQLEHRHYADVSQNILPGMTVMYEHLQRQGWATVARGQLCDDQAFYAAPYYRDFRRHIDCDDYVTSIRMVDVPRRPEGITIDRPHGAPRFGPREVALLKLLHDEIAPMVGTRLATEEYLCRDGLSKRLRQTLSLLLEGCSEKQIASALSLSPRTIHDYVTMLYQHFQVSSRAELLAYFIRRAPVPRKQRKPVRQ